ncbi:MAG: COX15/CtaA family protein, partial [Chitinophagaceae bacterium]
FHRLWARLLAVAFLVPFIYFLVRGTFQRSMILPMFYLFLLGGLQGFIGWIMVKSGLNPDDLYVSHYRLAIHFLTALVLLCYTLWFALRLLLPFSIFPSSRSLLIFPWILVPLLILQLIYGAFMAGLKAAAVAPTWPSLNGHWWISLQGVALTSDPLAVQFIHRLLAYLMVLIHVFWWWRVRQVAASSHQKRFLHLPVYLVLVQLGLGIATVLFSGNRHSLLVWGTLHQFSAMLLVLAWMTILYVQFVLRPAR